MAGIDRVSYAVKELLIGASLPGVNDNVHFLGNGVHQNATLPKITVSSTLRGEHPYFSSNWGSGKRAKKCDYGLMISVYSHKADQVETLAERITDLIEDNRGFHPKDSTRGYFINMLVTDGTPTKVDAAKQMFVYVVEAKAEWLSIRSR